MNGGYVWIGVLVAAFSARVANGVVFISTGDPHYNTTAPSGALADSGWQFQGDSFPGIPIAPNYFIAATHLGGKIGDIFAFRHEPYLMTAQFVHPTADLTIWQVREAFPEFAPLYRSSDEVGKPFVVFGRGAQRGEEVRLDGVLKGWNWGTPDGILRWGENFVSGITDQYGEPATGENEVQLLRADFRENGGPNEAHLSGGDSGGAFFMREEGVWKLAGVNHAAKKDYSYTEKGTGFAATLFDESGLFQGEDGQRDYVQPGGMAKPGSFYATRISAYRDWIDGVLAGEIPSNVVLEESSDPSGPYRVVTGARVNLESSTIAIRRPPETRFYRLIGDRPHVITGMTGGSEELLISYR